MKSSKHTAGLCGCAVDGAGTPALLPRAFTKSPAHKLMPCTSSATVMVHYTEKPVVKCATSPWRPEAFSQLPPVAIETHMKNRTSFDAPGARIHIFTSGLPPQVLRPASGHTRRGWRQTRRMWRKRAERQSYSDNGSAKKHLDLPFSEQCCASETLQRPGNIHIWSGIGTLG